MASAERGQQRFAARVERVRRGAQQRLQRIAVLAQCRFRSDKAAQLVAAEREQLRAHERRRFVDVDADAFGALLELFRRREAGVFVMQQAGVDRQPVVAARQVGPAVEAAGKPARRFTELAAASGGEALQLRVQRGGFGLPGVGGRVEVGEPPAIGAGLGGGLGSDCDRARDQQREADCERAQRCLRHGGCKV